MIFHDTLAKKFGNNVRIRRKKLNLSQEELAERLSISHQSLSRIEQGRIAPKFERLSDIAVHLGCSVQELFGDFEKAGGVECELEELLRRYNLDKAAVVNLLRHLVAVLK